MLHRCDTLLADPKGRGKKKKLRNGGARGSSSVAMPNPLIKWAKRNTHSDPPPSVPLGAKKVDATSPFLTPALIQSSIISSVVSPLLLASLILPGFVQSVHCRYHNHPQPQSSTLRTSICQPLLRP